MYTPFRMDGKSPVMKKLIGGQKNLARNGAPELQAAISASPARKNKSTGAQNLLKHVNEEVYNKLPPHQKAAFNIAAKKNNLPMKNSLLKNYKKGYYGA